MGRPPNDQPLAERFWDRVEVRGEHDCWTWQGPIGLNGYGQFSTGRRRSLVYAHRFSYELLVGPIADGMVIDHLCRNTRCINPAHLEAVTQAENARRGLRGRLYVPAETCRNGHPASETRVGPHGDRHCRVCERAGKRRWKAKKAVAA